MSKGEDLYPNNNGKKIAAIVMDLQPKLIASFDSLPRNALLESIDLLLDAMNCLNIPVINTEQVPNKLGKTLNEIALKVSTENIVMKETFSAFRCNDFNDCIKKYYIDHILLSGIETSICIYLTAIDALKRGIGVTVLSDCVLSRRSEDAKTALRQVTKAGAHVLPLETVVYSLLGGSSHPQFKTISNFIKRRNI